MGTTGTRRVENGDAPPPQYEEAISPEILATLATSTCSCPTPR